MSLLMTMERRTAAKFSPRSTVLCARCWWSCWPRLA